MPPSFLEGGIDRSLHFGGGRNEFFPGESFGDDFDALATLIESVDLEILLLAGSDRKFSGDDLELGDWPCRLVGDERSFWSGEFSILAAEAVEAVASGEINFARPNGGGGEAFHAGAVIGLDVGVGEHFGFGVAGFGDYEGALEPRGVDFSITVGWGGVDLIGSHFLVPESLAIVGIDRDQFTGEVGSVNAVFHEDGGTGESDVFVIAPKFGAGFEDDLFLGILGRDFKTDKATFRGGVDIFLSVKSDELVLPVKDDL